MTVPLLKSLYTADAIATGGRDGRGATSDGQLIVELRAPKELGGPGGGTNPEQLFAIGYAACFHSAIGVVGRLEKVDLSASTVESHVSFGPVGGDAYGLAIRLDIHLPGVEHILGEKIVAAAHEVCPYSNAIRGNVEVILTVFDA